MLAVAESDIPPKTPKIATVTAAMSEASDQHIAWIYVHTTTNIYTFFKNVNIDMNIHIKSLNQGPDRY